ncbi:hypothetical protein NMD75_04295 [Edwardsiella tarda]
MSKKITHYQVKVYLDGCEPIDLCASSEPYIAEGRLVCHCERKSWCFKLNSVNLFTFSPVFEQEAQNETHAASDKVTDK